MDFSKMTAKEIESFIKLFQEIYNGKYGTFSVHNKNLIIQELRDAKLEIILLETKVEITDKIARINCSNCGLEFIISLDDYKKMGTIYCPKCGNPHFIFHESH